MNTEEKLILYFIACETWMQEVTSMVTRNSKDYERNDELYDSLRAVTTLRPRLSQSTADSLPLEAR